MDSSRGEGLKEQDGREPEDMGTRDERAETTRALGAESEVESLLGPDVRTPVGIPRDYRPLDVSTHSIFKIQLSDFAGPLDLLLFLIRRHDVDIFDIPVHFITERYLATLEALSTMPIDVAAEFLVLATELTHIKSKMLLPAQQGIAVEVEETDEGDPRAELVRRLLEYQKYREAAENLGGRDLLGRDVFGRVPASVVPLDDSEAGLKSVSIFRLVELMARMMKRHPAPHEIELDAFRIGERIDYVHAFGETRDGKFLLIQLLDSIRSRAELVVTFIAVLEMTRLGLLRLSIEEGREGRGGAIGPNGANGSMDGRAPEASGAQEEALPVIWVNLTGKALDAQVVDDYR